ncbi:MAG: endonuclease III domain-containing protein [Planctomycetota bacterium]|jgi:endonuclease-3
MAKAKKQIKVDPAEAKERLLKILPLLKKTYPDAKIALNWDTPWNLLVAVILSAQCTDVRVNIITQDLFKKYKRPQDYLKVSSEELEQDIRSSGFFRNKAKNIRGAAEKIINDFGGQVTHVIRLSRRLGLSEKRDPVKLEFDLMDVVPKRKYGGWTMFSHYIIFHGRNICKARKPDCENCPIAKHCPSANKPDLW